jgi:hypothetical protein
MRWFWVGIFISVPTSFILGYDEHTVWLVRQYTALYGFIVIVATIIYKKWRGLRIDDPVLKNSMTAQKFFYSAMFVAGHLIGFATIGLFRNIL